MAEDKRLKHINFLKKVGFLIRYNDLELYHGRCGNGKAWSINVDFDNSADVNRDNIMGIPCLCVASYPIAESYAKGASLSGMTGEVCVYKIVSDDDALIADESFNVGKLSEGDAIKFFQAIRALSKGRLRSFLTQEQFILSEVEKEYGLEGLIDEECESVICEKIRRKCGNVDNGVVRKVVGAINASLSFERMPVTTISDFVFVQKDRRCFFPAGGRKYSFNQNLIRYILDKNNIISLKKRTFLKENNNVVYIFGLNKVKIDEMQREEEMQK